VKLALAHELVARFHSFDEANHSQESFLAVFSRKALPDAIDERMLIVPREGLVIAQVLKAAGLVASTSEGLRLIRQGGVKVDGERVTETLMLMPQTVRLVQVGKRRFLRLEICEKGA